MHDQNQQATSTQPTIETKAAVAGQASGGAHNDGTKTHDSRSRAELDAAGAANRATQAVHALPEVKQCVAVEGQAKG